MLQSRSGKLGIMAASLVVLVALALAGNAAAEKPVTVKAGNLELTFNGGFSPEDQADADQARRLRPDQDDRRVPSSGAAGIHPRNRQERRR
jgi:hypothetical protein